MAPMSDSPSRTELLICPRCNRPHDQGDRYCRRCGVSISSSSLLTVRGNYQPALWRPAAPAIIGGAAAIAAGALAEIALRRLVKVAFRPSSLLPVLRHVTNKPAQRQQKNNGHSDDDLVETEAVFVKRIWVRRSR